MNIRIKVVNESNYEEMIKLNVEEEQVDFIESVEECLNEAKENSIWRPVGIYDEDNLVGFAMYGLFIDEGKKGRVWLDRFLISAENQGKGYGKVAVRNIVKRLYDEYGYNKIYLSVYDNNKVAILLYKKVGFLFNGEVDEKGEKIMVLDLSKLPN